MQVVPWIFGIAHPTGFPLFVIACGIFAHLFALGTVAWRTVIFTSLAGAGSAWLVYRIVLDLSVEIDPKSAWFDWIALGSSLAFALGDTVWVRATRTEVHVAALFFALLALRFALRWYRVMQNKDLLVGALCWGLALATHPISLMLFPAFLFILLERYPALRLRTVAFAVLLLAAGLSFYAYLPLRSQAVTAARLDPTLQLGEPPGQAFWDFGNPATVANLRTYMTNKDYNLSGAFAGMFRWRTYAENLPAYYQQLWAELTAPGLLLMLAGIVFLWRRHWQISLALVLAAAVPTMFALSYQLESDVARYYLISFGVAAIFVGYGACALAVLRPRLAWLPSLATFGLAVALAILNRSTFSQRGSLEAREIIAAVQNETPKNSIVSAAWLNATPLAYAAYVEHSLDQRIVVNGWIADVADRVPVWVKSRPMYVVGEVFGAVPGYRFVQISQYPDLYRVSKK